MYPATTPGFAGAIWPSYRTFHLLSPWESPWLKESEVGERAAVQANGGWSTSGSCTRLQTMSQERGHRARARVAMRFRTFRTWHGWWGPLVMLAIRAPSMAQQ